MTKLPDLLIIDIKNVLIGLYGEISLKEVKLQRTNSDFVGDYTLVVFPFLNLSKASPEITADQIGKALQESSQLVKSFNVVKGFLNLSIKDNCWTSLIQEWIKLDAQLIEKDNEVKNIMIEYPSPNTNKPLHLGHLRNIFLGAAVSSILKARGNTVVHSCLYNDRGTNISKSMLAWMKYAKGASPADKGMKGDKFVGEMYVKYSTAYKEEMNQLMNEGCSEDEATKQSILNKEVNELTVKWENGDKDTRDLWSKMNSWVYEGFEQTFKKLGIKPDKFYFESDVYNLGKETVEEGLEKGVFYRKEDGSVWIDLSADGLDHKLVLRSNGTTVYITQDIAVANEKEKDYPIDTSIYVVGNEQDYHFKVLFLILKKLGRKYADHLYHLSYGMVELPTGKMKSREGTVVDADDLIEEMIMTAKETTEELGKTEGFSNDELAILYSTIGLGALKYFILKVDPKKKMLFDPKESIDFNGHTGPFIQYTYARISSVLRKAGTLPNLELLPEELDSKERELIRLLNEFNQITLEAATTYNPSVIANYIYELAKSFNQFYHEIPILKEENQTKKAFRLYLSYVTAKVIKQGMSLLAIEVPEKM